MATQVGQGPSMDGTLPVGYVILGQYRIVSTIGQGKSSTVYCCIQVGSDSAQTYAVKAIFKPNLNTSLKIRRLEKECSCMSYLSHPNIVRLLYVLHDENNVYLVMPYYDGKDLLDFILSKRPPFLTGDVLRNIFHQVLIAIEYSHQNGIVHRDIKPENVFLSSDKSHVWVGDWGFAEQWSEGVKISERCGTLPYAPPEMFLNTPYYGPEVDVWSLGILLYVMSTGKFPFNGKGQEGLAKSVVHKEVEYPSHLSLSLQHLLSLLLVKRGSKRPSVSEILQHPWIRQPSNVGIPGPIANSSGVQSMLEDQHGHPEDSTGDAGDESSTASSDGSRDDIHMEMDVVGSGEGPSTG